ncbi:xylulose kinase-1 [Tanacetum coccineum]
MCDKKNSVLFTDTACFVLSPDFKLADESQVLLKVPRKNNMYSVDMKNIVPKESLTCLVAKATLDESMLWHRRLGHVNFKTINKLVKDNLVRGLPSKHFENDQTCVACLKGKQHKASCNRMKVLVQESSNDEPQPSSDAGKKDGGVRKESGIDNQERPENSTQDINTVGLSINTTSTNITNGSLNINIVRPIVTTARSNGYQTELDMFSLGDNATLEATHADFFGDEITKHLSTPMETSKPLLKDAEAEDVDVHLYRSMIRSLMYLTASTNETVIKEWEERIERAATTASSLEAEQDSGNINRTQLMTKLNESFPQGTGSGSGPRCQDTTLGGAEAQIRFKTASKQSNDPPLSRVNTLGSGEDSMKLMELMDLCIKLLEKFWQTATASILDNGEIEITATIDEKVKTVSEASIRRHIKLDDYDGISNFPTTEIFEQLALMGSTKPAWEQFSSNITTAIICLATNRKFNFSKLIFDGMTPIADETVHEERGDSVERVATIAASLDAEQDSGGSPRRQETTLGDMPTQTRFERLSKQPHDSPLPRVNTLRSDEGSLKLQELTVLCTKLSTKVDNLEADLKQTKQIYGAAFTKLIKKDPSKQGRKIAKIDEDPDISLVQHDAEVQGRHEHDMEPDFEFTTAEEVYTAEKEVSTAEPVSTAGASVSTTGASLAKDKGKAIMEEAETVQTKTKLQLEQERLGYEEALRLLAKTYEEERQRIARVQEEASSFNIEEWDDIQARVEANEEFAQRLQSEEREMYSEAEKARLLAELINERKRYFAAQRAKERRNKPLTQAQ